MFDEKECIFFINENMCKINIEKIQAKEYEDIPHFCCCNCKDKQELKEGQEVEIEEYSKYKLKRINGKLMIE